MEKFITAAGTATRYSSFGIGEKVILLIHGYLEAIEIWDSFAGKLGKQYKVIAVDLPGSGWSDFGGKTAITMEFMADVIYDVLQKEGVSKCTVIGHSMGGYASLALAKNHPDVVEKLVLMHSSPYGDTPEKKEHRQREIEIIKQGKKELLSRLNPTRGFAKENVRRCVDTIEELAEQIMITEDDAIVATLEGMMLREDNCEFFAQAKFPRLMIFGTEDNYIPLELAQKMIESFPTAEHVIIESAGHMSFIEQPDKTLEVISNFV